MWRTLAKLIFIQAAAVCAGSLSAQVPFRAGIDLVPVYATATDRAGRLVTDLRSEEFEVFDNGKRQRLTTFSNDQQPFSIVILLDRSGSMADYFDVVRESAIEFVERLMPGDRVRIGSFSHEIRLSPDAFTSDRAELGRILREDLQDIGPSPVWIALDRSITALAKEPGRRVVLLFSDGHDDPPAGLGTITRFDDVLRRVRVADVMVYAVGIGSVTAQSRSRLWSPSLPLPGRPGQLFPRPRAPGQPQPRIGGNREKTEPDPRLKLLAGESGGGYFELGGRQNLRAVFSRVSDELHRQYWLGFRAVTLDDRLHQIKVKVKRPNVDVRARKSYVASTRRPS
jgi:VWFA-related protein